MNSPYIFLRVLWNFDDQKFKWWGEKNSTSVSYYISIYSDPSGDQNETSIALMSSHWFVPSVEPIREGMEHKTINGNTCILIPFTTIKQSGKKRMRTYPPSTQTLRRRILRGDSERIVLSAYFVRVDDLRRSAETILLVTPHWVHRSHWDVDDRSKSGPQKEDQTD